MFRTETFIERCTAAISGPDPEQAMREVVAEAVSDPASVASALGEPVNAGLVTLVRTPTLTVLDVNWAPWMSLKPHNHRMWSVLGLYAGREDNVFWRRTGERIEAAGARSLGPRDVTVLGRDIIHSVLNPIGRRTRAIHVYAGDFFAPAEGPRSEWDPETLTERPWDIEDTKRGFAAAEARARTRPNGE